MSANVIPFETVYEEQFSYVYNYVYMMLLNKEITEDIVSESFLKAYKNYSLYDPEKSGVRTWLCRIAKNTVIDHARSQSAKKVISIDEAPEPSYEEEYKALQSDANRRAFEVLKGLTQRERVFLALRYKLELSNDEVAALTNSNPKAVSEKYRRILAKSRKLLEKNGISGEDLF